MGKRSQSSGKDDIEYVTFSISALPPGGIFSLWLHIYGFLAKTPFIFLILCEFIKISDIHGMLVHGIIFNHRILDAEILYALCIFHIRKGKYKISL